MKKILFIATLVGIAGLGFLFAIGRETPAQSPAAARAIRPEAERLAPRAEPLPLASNVPVPLPPADEPNATRLLSEKIAKELLVKNPNGPALLEGKRGLTVDDPEAIVDMVLSEELARMNFEEFKPTVNAAEFNIVPASKAASEKFFAEFKEALMLYAAHRITGNNPRDLSPLVRVADEAIAKLKIIPVPANLAAILAKELTLVTTERNIYDAVAHADTDPFRALVALQMWDPLNAEFSELSAAITAFVRTNNIKL